MIPDQDNRLAGSTWIAACSESLDEDQHGRLCPAWWNNYLLWGVVLLIAGGTLLLLFS